MNLLDLIIVAVVVLSTLIAAAHGFFFELFSFAGVIVGYILAAWQYGRLSPVLLPYAKAGWVADLASFLIIFIVVALLAGIAGRLARWGVGQIGLGWFDRLLGAAFGLARGALIVVVIALGLAAFVPQSQLLAKSRFAPYFLVIGRGAVWVAPAQVREQFRAGLATLRSLAEQAQHHATSR
jgi:membrane protein required for colicin V production